MTSRLMQAAECSVGQRLACAVCLTSVVVLSVRDADVRLTCCAAAMRSGTPVSCSTGARTAQRGSPMRAGHAYADLGSGLIVRCIRAGSGRVAAGGRPLVRRLRAAV